MKIEATEFLPQARAEGIITKEVEGELLVYDRSVDKAHCLNETAAAVWKLCDGRTSVTQISERLAYQSRQKADCLSLGTQPSALNTSPRQKAEGLSLSTQPSALNTSQPDTQLVWLALDQLRRSHLLEEQADVNGETNWAHAIPGLGGMSRRDAVRRIGLGAIALPLVMSMTAPNAEAATSCFGKCHSCSTSAVCCGTCAPTVSGCPGAGMKCT